jgi:U4/U6.U5 tri-snRNP-associated protein 1
MTEDEKREEVKEAEKKALRPKYSGTDDHEFEDSASVGQKRSVLSHYDEEKKKGPELVLGAGGVVDESRMRRAEEIKKRLAGESAAAMGKTEASLEMNKKQSVKEYYTEAEYLTFSKPKKRRKKKKFKTTSLADELEATADVAMSTSSDAKDMRGRNEKSTTKEKMVAEERSAKQDRFDLAAQRMQEKTDQTFKGKELTPTEAVVDTDADLDAELNASLQRARRLAQKKESKTVKMDPSLIVKQLVEDTETKEKIKRELNADMGIKEEKLVFTSTTEFSKRIEANLSEKREEIVKRQKRREEAQKLQIGGEKARKQQRDKAEAGGENAGDVEMGASSDWKEVIDGDSDDDKVAFFMRFFSTVKLQSILLLLAQIILCVSFPPSDLLLSSSGLSFVPVSSFFTCLVNSTPTTKDDADEQGFGTQQNSLVSGGMAATLSMLQKGGDLHFRDTEQATKFGRTKDQKLQQATTDDYKVNDRVKLEYRDSYGNLLTQKEAYRQLSYKFHGQQPGKKKTDKRLAKVKDYKATYNMVGGDTPLGTVAALKKKTEASGQAYVTLQTGKK